MKAMEKVEKVIMTVTGPLAPEEVSGLVLCREWLLNDQSQLHMAEPIGPMERIELCNLAKIRRYPLSCFQNLHLNYEDALRELSALPRGSLVLVTTPPQFRHGHGHETLKALARDTKQHLVVGTVPPNTLPEVAVASVLSDLAIDGGPGFIGELEGTDLESLKVAVEAQRQCEAPILIVGDVSKEAWEVLRNAHTAQCAFFDVSSNSEVGLRELETKGFIGFSAPHCGSDVSWHDYCCRRPCRTEMDFRTRTKSLVASGLRFRMDLSAFGGTGLSYGLELSERDSERLRSNAMTFLSYPWAAPIAPEKVLHDIQCHWCGTTKREGEHFSKMGFDYCSPRCIAQHRKADFDPVACEPKRERHCCSACQAPRCSKPCVLWRH